MSGEFGFRKDSHSTKFKLKPRIFSKLSFREFCDSKLSGLYPFDNMIIIHELKLGQKQKVRLQVHETPILEKNFVTFTEYSSVTNDTQAMEVSTPPEIAVGTSMCNMALKLSQYF